MGLCSTARRKSLHINGASVHDHLAPRGFSSPHCSSLKTFSIEMVYCGKSLRRRTIGFPSNASAVTGPSNPGITTSTPITSDRVFRHESCAVAPSRSAHTQEQLAARGEVKSLVTGANGTRVGTMAIRHTLNRLTDIPRSIQEEKSSS